MNRFFGMRGKRLTATQFEIVRPFLRIADDRIQAAYESLVMGRPLRDIAGERGCAHQNVAFAVNSVWDAWLRYKESLAVSGRDADVPAGWARETFVAPVELIERFRAEVAALGRGRGVRRKAGAG